MASPGGSSAGRQLLQADFCVPWRSFMKVGTMVFLCHDVTDIFMETAKMFGYVERKRTSIAFFVWFIVIWFAARLYYFPVYVIRSVWSEPIEVRGTPIGATFAGRRWQLRRASVRRSWPRCTRSTRTRTTRSSSRC